MRVEHRGDHARGAKSSEELISIQIFQPNQQSYVHFGQIELEGRPASIGEELADAGNPGAFSGKSRRWFLAAPPAETALIIGVPLRQTDTPFERAGAFVGHLW